MKRAIHKMTLGAGILGLATVGIAATAIILEQAGVIHLMSDHVNEYTLSYYVEGTLYNEQTLKRGDQYEVLTVPTKKSDLNGSVYIPLGWDSIGTGIPNMFEGTKSRIYTNITANAVYYQQGLEDIDIDKLMDLLDLLEQFGIDSQDILSRLGLDETDFIKQFMKTDFQFTSKMISLPIYFRSEAFGDLRTGRFEWSSAPYYTADKYCPNGSDPQSFASDKMNQRYEDYNIDITYLTEGTKYPVPMYEVGNTTYGELQSDSYALTNPIENEDGTWSYSSKICYPFNLGGFKWYSDELAPEVDQLVNLSFTDNAIAKDEEKYSDFVHKNYLSVPSKYSSYLSKYAQDNQIGTYSEEGYHLLDKVRTAVKSIAQYNLMDYDLGGVLDDPIIKFMEESEYGAGEHFNTVATLLFRTLGLPARYVGGYRYIPIGIDEEGNLSEDVVQNAADSFVNNKTNDVSRLLKHNWTEVYIDRLGWIEVDCCPFFAEIESQVGDIEQFLGGSSKEGDVETNLPSIGPGSDGYDNDVVFTFGSDYVGTQYFKSKSYTTFNDNNWENDELLALGYSTFLSNQGIEGLNSAEFTGKAARCAFTSHTFDIKYEVETKSPVAPFYTDTVYSHDSDWVMHPKVSGPSKVGGVTSYEDSQACYNGYNIAFTEDNINMLRSQKFRSSITEDSSSLFYTNEDYLKVLAYEGYFTNQYLDTGSYNSLFESIANSLNIGMLSSDYEKITAIVDYFKNNYTFSVDYLSTGTGSQVDNLSYFMNESKTGDSSYFATGLTMLLRACNFPARFVTGYGAKCNGMYYNNITSSYQYRENVVTKETSHCWSEVYIYGVGWMMLDATGFEDGHGSNDGLGNDWNTDEDGDPIEGQYGSGFGGDGVNEEPTIIAIELDMIIDGLTIEDGVYTLTKTYDGKPFSWSNITRKGNKMLWPGDRFEFHAEDLDGYIQPGEYSADFYFLIINDETSEIVYDSRHAADYGEWIGDIFYPTGRYYDPNYQTYPDVSHTYDGVTPTYFNLIIERRPITITISDLTISENDWYEVYGCATIDVTDPQIRSQINVSISYGYLEGKYALGYGDTATYSLSGSLSTLGKTTIQLVDFKITNSQKEDVTTSCYSVTPLLGKLTIGAE